MSATIDQLTCSLGGFDAYALKSDTVDFPYGARSLYIGVTGNVKVTTIDGSVLTFVGVQAGSILPVQVARLWSAGTTSTSVLGLK